MQVDELHAAAPPKVVVSISTPAHKEKGLAKAKKGMDIHVISTSKKISPSVPMTDNASTTDIPAFSPSVKPPTTAAQWVK